MNRTANGNNVVWHNATVTRKRREGLNRHKSAVIWFTGLSASGKSTLAHTVEEKLHQLRCRTYVFDGDNVRHGLCSDLGFTPEDRKENIRRIGEMVNLFLDAGVIAMTAFISPFRADRHFVRDLVGEQHFIEIYTKCPVEICEKRDAKGLYAKAKNGLIKDFTGISSPYEEPEAPDLIIDTEQEELQASADRIIGLLYEKGIIQEHGE